MSEEADRGRAVVGAMVDEWQSLRAEIRALEELEHPSITDVLGREWTWWQGDLYRHDSMATPVYMIGTDRSRPGRWPCASLPANPNYRWCAYCLAHRDQWPDCP